MDFTTLQQALSDATAAEKDLENKAASDDTAQKALVDAQNTAKLTAQDKLSAVVVLQTKITALDEAAAAVEAQLEPAPPAPVAA